MTHRRDTKKPLISQCNNLQKTRSMVKPELGGISTVETEKVKNIQQRPRLFHNNLFAKFEDPHLI